MSLSLEVDTLLHASDAQLLTEAESIDSTDLLSDTILFSKSLNTDSLCLFYKEHFLPGDTVQVLSTVTSVGKEGSLIPSRLYADNVLSVVLFFCFSLISYVLFRRRRYLEQQIKNFFFIRERPSLFAIETRSDVRYRLLLLLQMCLILGVFFYDYTHDCFPELIPLYPSYAFMGCYVGVVVIWYILKIVLFAWVDWIFFDKQKSSIWVESYTLAHSLFGILLFPLLLFVVFFNLSPINSLICFVVIGMLIEIMLFYKCFNIFFNKIYGFFYFIVYLCALELVPCFLLWRALVLVNELLIIKN